MIREEVYSPIRSAIRSAIGPSSGSPFAIDATADQIRAAMLDPASFASGGWRIPGTAGARLNASARSSVAMQVRRDDLLGPELVANGAFDSATGWTPWGTGWSIAGGVLSANSAAWAGMQFSGAALTSGRTYAVSLVMTRTTGTLQVYGNEGSAALATASGIYYFVAGGTATGFKLGSIDFVGTIDNVSVREVVIPAGGYEFAAHNLLTNSTDLSGAGWGGQTTTVTVVADGNELAATGADSFWSSSIAPVVGAQYTMVVDLRAPGAAVSLNCYFLQTSGGFGVSSVNLTSEWQTVTITVTATNTNALFFQIGGGSTFTAGEVIRARRARLCFGPSAAAYVPTTTAAVYAPAITWNAASNRYLVQHEPARTNAIRNSTAQGAVAGSPGTLPTNWSIGSDPQIGTVTRTITTGTTLAGLPAIDLRFQFTATSAGRVFVAPGNETFAPGASTASVLVQGVAGSFTNVTTLMNVVSWGAGPTVLLDAYTTGVAVPTAAPGFGELSNTAPASTISNEVRVSFAVTAAGTYDFTIRLAGFQLEQAATRSSPILTYGATATRAMDQAQVVGLPEALDAQGTVVVDFVRTAAAAAGEFPGVFDLGISATNRHIAVVDQSVIANVFAERRVGGVTQGQVGGVGSSGLNRIAYAYTQTEAAMAQNGGATSQVAATALPAGPPSRLNIGLADNSLNGGVARVRLAAQRLPNAALQALAA